MMNNNPLITHFHIARHLRRNSNGVCPVERFETKIVMPPKKRKCPDLFYIKITVTLAKFSNCPVLIRQSGVIL